MKPETRTEAVIVAALHQEFTEIRKHLLNEAVSEDGGIRSFCGELEGKRVALVVSGVGIQNAARATRRAIKRHSPKVVVSIGYAGGLAPEAGPAAIILPSRVRNSDASNVSSNEAQEMTPDTGLLKLAQSAASRIRLDPLGGTILTVPAIVSTPEAKKALRASSGAVAVDMESAAVGRACREAGVRVVFMRCVTDGAEDEVPVGKEISAAFRGRIRIWPLLAGFIRRPSMALAIWRLFRRARRASATLGRLVRAFCEDLG